MNGKKLLVFSDSHGYVKSLKAVFSWANERLPPNDTIRMVACLGDGLSDLRNAADATGFYCEWKLICGNNDYDFPGPDSAVLEFADHRFYMCHGHRHNLSAGVHALIASARHNNADTVLFGHTHVPFFKITDGITIINPGSVGSPRSRIGASFAVIECPEESQLKVDFYGIGDKGKIKKVKI